ncbi:MAG: TonB-dependent receptor [Pseudomonadota bacterium]
MRKLSRLGVTGSVLAATVLTGMATSAAAQEFIEEIVVTARKKSETVQTVPVAVTAISADQIVDLNIQDFSEISKLTAGLLFDNEFGRTSNRPVIRGQANILGSSGVSFFIDGVYIEGSLADFDLNDVERFEIVKGPQSALYGRNTYSGAINVITKSPGDSLGGNAALTLSEDGETEISASIRGPIIQDTLAGSLSVRRFELDGPWTNEFDNTDIGLQKSSSMSGVLEWTPNDRFKARFRGYYNDLDDGQPPLFAQAASNNNCFEDDGGLYNGLGRYFCGTVRPQAINTDFSVQAPEAREEQQTLQTSLTLNFDITDDWSFTSITGFNDRDGIQVTDGDYSPTSFQVANFTPNGFPFDGFFDGPPFDYAYVGSIVDFTFSNWAQEEDFSQEIRFAYRTDTLSAIIGGYYYSQEVETRDIRQLPADAAAIAGANFGAEFGRMLGVCAANFLCESIVPFFGPTIDVPSSVAQDDLTNTALFGLVEFPLSNTVSLTLEGRYQEEDVEQVVVSETGATPLASEASFDAFLQRYTLDWQATDDVLVYGVVATGTKPGGFNGPLAIEAGLPTFDEEEVTSLEVGVKSAWFDGRLVANLAAYSNTINGYQLTQNARSGANTTSATVNAGDARINGMEFELTARPSEWSKIVMNYAYTDAEFRRGFDENQGVLNDVADDGLVNCSQGEQFGNTDCDVSAFGSIEGNKIPRTARHQFYIDAELRGPAQGDWEWFVGSDYSFESSRFAQVHNLAETGDAGLLGARLGLVSDRYSIILFGKNLLGEDSSPLVLRYADGADSFKRSFVGTARRDTHWGINFNARFGD